MILMGTLIITKLMKDKGKSKEYPRIEGPNFYSIEIWRWERAIWFMFWFKSRFRVEDVAQYRPRNFYAYSLTPSYAKTL